jgi:regulator of sigma E protease
MITTIFVILAISFLIFIHELGHFSSAKLFKVYVEEFGIGFPPKIFKKKFGETVYSLNWLLFGGFVKIWGEDGEGEEKTKDTAGEIMPPERGFSAQKTWKKVVMLAAGVFMNFAFGWVLFSSVYMVGMPEHLVISEIQNGSPAFEQGLKPGDMILKAQFKDKTLNDPVKAADFTAQTKENRGGEVMILVKRGAEEFSRVAKLRENPPEGQGAFGVYLADAGLPPQPFFKSFVEGAKETWYVSEAIAVGFWDLVSKIFTTPREATESIAGPVGIVVIAKETSALGLVYFFQLLALISINLAVLNLLPFPALDGGRIVLALIEKIKGSPVSQKIQMVINGAGFVFLLGLMLLATVKDVIKLF